MVEIFGQSTGSSTAVTPSLKFPRLKPTVTLPSKEFPIENSHLLRYPFTIGDSIIPSRLHGRPPISLDLRIHSGTETPFGQALRAFLGSFLRICMREYFFCSS
uniref:Uncharacterized protein n=1 Tax=Medicago truncatula TaxID=3880 RepID=I3SDF3_MEDTR|nr:unknown [Medicago truncatula]